MLLQNRPSAAGNAPNQRRSPTKGQAGTLKAYRMAESSATITGEAARQKGTLIAANSATCRGHPGPPSGNLPSIRNARGVSRAQGKYQPVQAKTKEKPSRSNR